MATDTQLLKGVLEGCILGLINDKASYGYLIVEKLKQGGFDNIQEATVYPILTRLEKRGLLLSERRPSAVGPPRKYYLLTDMGKYEMRIFIKSFNSVASNVKKIFEEEIQ